MILWLKSFHIIFMVTWFAGLFYLPRLFVYHAMAKDDISYERFKIMERKLYNGIMTPGMLLTILFGVWLLIEEPLYAHMQWLQIKLLLVFALIIFHFYCGYLVRVFKLNRNQHSDKFYRWLNEFPTVILISIVILAIVKPF
jgi:putative membrane protein